MRDYHRSEMERPRLNLVRGPDGRLRLADSPSRDGDRGAGRQTAIRPVMVRPEASSPPPSPSPSPSSPLSPPSSPSPSSVSPIQIDNRHQYRVLDSVDGIFEKDPKPPRQKPAAASRAREQQQSEQEEQVRYPAFPSIKLPSLPKLSLSKIKARAGKKHILAAAAVVVVIMLGSSVFGWIGQGGKTENNTVAEQSQTPGVLHAGSQAPQFDAVLPQGKTIEKLGGWVRVSPPDKDPVFAFVDVVNGVQLNVSQQELPQNLRTDTAKKVAELAEGFAANEKIIADGVEAYVGTSIRGPQSVIFVKNDLLILIKSSSRLTNQQWAAYIHSLR